AAPAAADARHRAERLGEGPRVVPRAPAARRVHVAQELARDRRVARLQRAALARPAAPSLADLPDRWRRRRAPARLGPHVGGDDPEVEVREPARRQLEAIEEAREARGELELQ